ncbi:MAG: hypothetical protein ABIF71_12065 [Planctomycetota bacterium]
MGSYTAQILSGASHLYHGGIQQSHIIFLSENSRPVWIAMPWGLKNNQMQGGTIHRLVATVDDMLEDGILFVATHIDRRDDILELGQSFHPDFGKDMFEMYDLGDNNRKKLYAMVRTLTDLPKLVISVFHGSSLRLNLAPAKEYRSDIELCLSTRLANDQRWQEDPK